MPKLLRTIRVYSYRSEDEKAMHLRKMKRENFFISEDNGLEVVYCKIDSRR